MANDEKFAISVFEGKCDTSPHRHNVTWDDFLNLMSAREFREEKDGAAWSSACFRGGKRSNSTVEALSLIAMDFDHADVASVREALTSMDAAAVLYSTHSHQPADHCFRVVIRPSRSIMPDEWPRVWDAMNGKLGGQADKQTRDISRIYYAPSCPPDGDVHAFTEVLSGSPIDIDTLLKEKPATRRSSKKADSNGRVNPRAIADDVQGKMSGGSLWYYQGDFRVYKNGFWPVLAREQLEKDILLAYSDLSASSLNEVVRTLEKLCVCENAQVEEGLGAICVCNGTLDPTTGRLRDHSEEPRLLYGLDVDWDNDAQAPLFRKVLHDMWGEEEDFEDRCRFLQEFFGYILLPSNRYGTFLFLYGAGANGKSLLTGTMERLVGPTNVSHAALDRLAKAATRASLSGKLLNVSAEIDADAVLPDGYLKAIATGDAMDGELKYRNPFTFKPYVKLVASTNHLPRLRDSSEGFRRRAVILTCNRVFQSAEQDPLLDKKLENEAAGVLRWAVDGLRRLMERGFFEPPPSSKEIVESYRNDSDPVRTFFAEHLRLDEGAKEKTTTLYARFRDWALAAGCTNLPDRMRFGKALSTLGVAVTGRSRGVPLRGVRFINDDTRVDDYLHEPPIVRKKVDTFEALSQ